jgi:hypothetical protein
MDRFESSPFLINTAIRFLLDFLNEDFLAEMKFDLQNYTLGIFHFNETHLGFENGYLSFGFTADFSNTTVLKSMANTYMANYLETNTPTADLEMPPVEPHILSLMEETERGYQALIRSNQTLFETEQAKIRAARLKYAPSEASIE